MRILSMAFRNLGRNRRRTILAAVSVFFAVLTNMFLSGFMGAFLDSLVRNYTKNETGHVNITTEEYRIRERFMPLSESIPDSDLITAQVKNTPGIKTATSRIKFGVVLSSGANSKTAMAIAGDSETEKGLLMLDKSIKEGNYLSREGDAIVGIKLAETLGLGIGDTLKVVTQKSNYGLGMKRFTISGLFSTGVNEMDESVFMIDIKDARSLLDLQNSATQIIVMLNDYRQSQIASASISASLTASGFKDLSILPWVEIGEYGQLIALVEGVYFWVYVIFSFLGAFIIANIMIMIVLERRKEIGVLKSMGMPKTDIMKLFLMEGTLLGGLGAGAGAIGGIIATFILSRTGMDMTNALQSINYPMDNVLYPFPNPILAITMFILGTVVAMLLSLLPSRKAALMNPVDAIKSI